MRVTGRFNGCGTLAPALHAWMNANPRDAIRGSQNLNRRPPCRCTKPRCDQTMYMQLDAMRSVSIGMTATPVGFIPGIIYGRSASVGSASRGLPCPMQNPEDFLGIFGTDRKIAIRPA